MKTKNFLESLGIASVFIGTVIGAGFASGKELVQFFTQFGNKGLYGIILSGFLFALVAWGTLYISHIKGYTSYREFMEGLVGKWIAYLMESIVTLFMLACFCAMLAGAGAMLQQYFGIPYLVGSFVMALICFITFQFDIKGVLFINTLLVPILFLGAFVLGMHVMLFGHTEVFAHGVKGIFQGIKNHWLSMAILYVSYNMITTVVVLSQMGDRIKVSAMAKWAGMVGGGALGLLGICLGVATLMNYGKIIDVEIPLLEIVMQYNTLIQYLYMLVLLAAMYTTAVANGYGVLSRFTIKHTIGKRCVHAIIIMVSLVIASYGFSNLIEGVYPLFGYLGLFQMIMIILVFYQLRIVERRSGRRK